MVARRMGLAHMSARHASLGSSLRACMYRELVSPLLQSVLQPNLRQKQQITSMIVVPSINAIVTIGDFSPAPRRANACAPSVCVFHDIIHPDQMRIMQQLTHLKLLALGGVELPSPLQVESYSNLLKCHVKEVFEVFSPLVNIKIGDIHNIAFVFHANAFEQKYVNCAGMKRVFYIHYWLHSDGEFDCQIHIPFLNFYFESYPS